MGKRPGILIKPPVVSVNMPDDIDEFLYAMPGQHEDQTIVVDAADQDTEERQGRPVPDLAEYLILLSWRYDNPITQCLASPS